MWKSALFPVLVVVLAVGGFWLRNNTTTRLSLQCPAVQHCLDLEPGFHNSVVFMTCLRRIAAPLLWDPKRAWDECAAAAALAMVRKQFWAVRLANSKVNIEKNKKKFFLKRKKKKKVEARMQDNGPYYVATLIGEAYAHCLEEEKHCPGLSWNELEDFFAEDPNLRNLFQEYMDGRMPNFLSFKV